MEMHALLDVMERVLDESPAAVLSTVDADGLPHSRWMVATVLRGRRGALYSVTATDVPKNEQIKNNPRVSWLMQSPSMSEVLEVRGKAEIIDNPALKSDVLEALGRNLSAFWRVQKSDFDFVVLETAIQDVTYMQPLKGEQSTASM
jgi:pyridoxamine 5'-phosphate oxidase